MLKAHISIGRANRLLPGNAFHTSSPLCGCKEEIKLERKSSENKNVIDDDGGDDEGEEGEQGGGRRKPINAVDK